MNVFPSFKMESFSISSRTSLKIHVEKLLLHPHGNSVYKKNNLRVAIADSSG